MILAQTRLLVPKTLPMRREAESSAASVVIPATKTVKYRYLFIFDRDRRCGNYTVAPRLRIGAVGKAVNSIR